MLVLLTLSAALASTPYPAEIANSTGAPCEPACTLCHESAVGGSGTVVTEFGLAMMARGLGGGANTAALDDALDQMLTDNVDSDGDGVADVEEIAEGGTPNPGEPAVCGGVQPVYGCLNHTRPAAPTLLPVLAAVALALTWLRAASPR